MKKTSLNDRPLPLVWNGECSVGEMFAAWKDASTQSWEKRCLTRSFLALVWAKETVKSLAIPFIAANIVSLAASLPGPHTDQTTTDAFRQSVQNTQTRFLSHRLIAPDVVGTVDHSKIGACDVYNITAENKTTPFSFMAGTRKTNYTKTFCPN